MSKPKSIILLSGNGSNLKNIINKKKHNFINMDIDAVISDNPNAYGLKIAKKEKIKTFVIDSKKKLSESLKKIIDKMQIDIIILAGFMKILPEDFVKNYSGKILNIHPSLLPRYKGINTHKRVLEAKDSYHGASVHFVTTKLDDGPVIIQGKIEVNKFDNEDTLKEKVHDVEYEIYPLAIKWFTEGILKQSGRSYRFNDEEFTSPIEHIMVKR
jgi:phosphoribosylglycinamide formyltransferase-1